jgi:hypothetical protein
LPNQGLQRPAKRCPELSRYAANAATGTSEQEIIDDFPDLTQEDIRACLAFAADRERKLVSAIDP